MNSTTASIYCGLSEHRVIVLPRLIQTYGGAIAEEDLELEFDVVSLKEEELLYVIGAATAFALIYPVFGDCLVPGNPRKRVNVLREMHRKNGT
jgi:hypothetical protein